MRELLSNISVFVGQLYADKYLALRACDLLCFTTDLQTMFITELFTATADLSNCAIQVAKTRQQSDVLVGLTCTHRC